MPQVFQNPKWLVGEFQKAGEFDRLRKQLQTHFLNSDQVYPLMSRVEEIAREKLSSDNNLDHKTREAVYSEVMQDMERYPIVERAVLNLAVDKDEALLSSIDEYLRNILRGESNENTKLWNAQSSSSKGDQGDENDESSEYSEEDDLGEDDLLIITIVEPKEDGASSTKPPASENEILTNDAASLIALDEIKPTSGDAHPLSAPLNQRSPVSDSQSAPLSSSQNDASPSSAHTSPQLHARPNFPFPVGRPASSSSAGDLPIVDALVGCSPGQVVKSEHARAALDNHEDAEREPSSRDAPHLLVPVDANCGFHTTEALVLDLPPGDCDPDIQQQDASSPADGAGTYPLAVSACGSQGPSQTQYDAIPHQSPHDPHRRSPSPFP